MFARFMPRLAATLLLLLALLGQARAAADGYATKPPYALTLPGSDLSFGTSADVFGGILV